MPRLELVDRQPQQLVLPARNVRKIEQSHLLDVIRSIQTFGFCDPPLIDDNNSVLDGVIRVEAARRIGLTSIRCVQADHLSAGETRLLRLALNRLGENGQWDISELKLEFSELLAEGIAIDASGFSLAEIDHITIGAEDADVETTPLVPVKGAKSSVQIGDIFLLGRHRLICADSTSAESYQRLMRNDRARFVLTDQPYNVPISGHVTKSGHQDFVMASGEMNETEFFDFNCAWISLASRHLIDGGFLGTFIDWRGYPSVNNATRQSGLTQHNLIVWAKTNAGMGSLYRSQHELLPLYKFGTATHVNNIELGKNGRWRSNVWSYPGATSLGSESRKGLEFHPTVKPVSMLVDALMDITNRDEIVLDPFVGSGSTLIAAERSGRIGCGIELDPLYVELTLRRFEDCFGIQGVHEATGKGIAELISVRRDLDQF